MREPALYSIWQAVKANGTATGVFVVVSAPMLTTQPHQQPFVWCRWTDGRKDSPWPFNDQHRAPEQMALAELSEKNQEIIAEIIDDETESRKV